MASPELRGDISWRIGMFYEFWYVGNFIASSLNSDFAQLEKPTTGSMNPVIRLPLTQEDLWSSIESLVARPLCPKDAAQLLGDNGLLFKDGMLIVNLQQLSDFGRTIVLLLCTRLGCVVVDSIGQFRKPELP